MFIVIRIYYSFILTIPTFDLVDYFFVMTEGKSVSSHRKHLISGWDAYAKTALGIR
jgi:hypothetical protein